MSAPAAASDTHAALARLESRVTTCRRCPRLVAWREQVARERRAAFADEHYWGRPVPGFGDPEARVVIFGLAPAAHGANRTGRFFTGDRSGDFLFAGLHRAGFASSPVSRVPGDLVLHDLWITAAVRCAPPANRPTPAERDACLPWTAHELRLLGDGVRVVICLGAFAWDAALRLCDMARPPGAARATPMPRFGHGAEFERLLGCFHPSQQNTFTGKLTPGMLDDVLVRARDLAGLRAA